MRLATGIALLGLMGCGGPCGRFEAWQTPELDTGTTVGRFERACLADPIGSWSPDGWVELGFDPDPTDASQADGWRIRFRLSDRDLVEGQTLTVEEGLQGSAAVADGPSLDLTSGSLTIVAVGAAGDPCLGTNDIAIGATYSARFGESDPDGPGGQADGRGTHAVQYVDWCR